MQAAEDRRKRLKMMRQGGDGDDAMQAAPGGSLSNSASGATASLDVVKSHA